MKKIIFFLAIIISLKAFSQTCGSKAQEKDSLYTIHYGKGKLLSDVYELIQKHRNSKDFNQKTTANHIDNGILFNIPMKVWVYNRETPATPLPSMTNIEIEQAIEDLNFIFITAGIRFYIKCEIEQVFDNRFWSIDDEDDDYAMKETYHDEWALNMHVIGSGNTGRGQFPWRSLNASFSIASSNIYHIAHEIGHSLGLYHTFESRRGGTNNGSEGNCKQESVSRSKTQGLFCTSTVGKKKCEVNGDGFCDTDADYRTSDDFSSGSCGYIGTEKDNWGDSFVPPNRNIMSYWWFCRDSFTEDQYAAMVLYLGVYSPFISNYFSHNGVSFMNLNSLNINGDVYNGEIERYIVPEEIVNNDDLKINSGGELNLQAQQSITLQNGFHAKSGSGFNALVATITDCDNTYVSSSKVSSKGVNIVTYQNQFQEELNALVDNYITEEKENQLTKVNLTEVNQEIKIYPTLLEDNKTIKIDYNLINDEYITDISIYSISGIKVGSYKINNFASFGNIQMNIETINRGYYILKLKTNKQIQTTRIYVNN